MGSQHLSQELVQEKAGLTFKNAERIWKRFRRGMILQEEMYSSLYGEIVVEGVFDFLKEGGLKMDLEEDRFECFLKDWEAFQKGLRQEGGIPSPWLFTEHGKEAACPEDYRLILLLLDRLHLPAEYFRPFRASPDAARPERVYVHGYGPCTAWYIDYTCRDDGGLLSDPSPVGKTFTLTDHYGLKAALTVTKVRSARYWKEPDYDAEYILSHPEAFPSGIEYLTVGAIEGYTEVPRTNDTDIRIWVEDGKIKSISYSEYILDNWAFCAFPLWQPFFKEQKAFGERLDSIFKAAADELIKEFEK